MSSATFALLLETFFVEPQLWNQGTYNNSRQ
jgi:hypothetical protein